MQTILAVILIVIGISFLKSLSEVAIANITIIGGAIVLFLAIWFIFAFLVRWFLKIASGREMW